jgi:hypothetical protein
LLGGETGRDFVLYDEFGTERFSARLLDGSTELVIAWTDNVTRTLLRLHEVQRLTGGPGSFTSIAGTASDDLESAILSGAFDARRASRLVGRSLGGNWRVQVLPRPGSKPPVFDVLAERIGDEP